MSQREIFDILADRQYPTDESLQKIVNDFFEKTSMYIFMFKFVQIFFMLFYTQCVFASISSNDLLPGFYTFTTKNGDIIEINKSIGIGVDSDIDKTFTFFEFFKNDNPIWPAGGEDSILIQQPDQKISFEFDPEFKMLIKHKKTPRFILLKIINC